MAFGRTRLLAAEPYVDLAHCGAFHEAREEQKLTSAPPHSTRWPNAGHVDVWCPDLTANGSISIATYYCSVLTYIQPHLLDCFPFDTSH